MSKQIKCLIGVTFFVCICFLSACGAIFPASLVNTREIGLENVGVININYSSDDVTVFAGDGDVLVVKEFMSENNSNFHANIESRDGNVTIRSGRRPARPAWSSYVEIHLPESFEGSLTIRTTSGDITVNGSYSLDRLNLQASSGDVNVNDVSANTVNIQSTSGDVRIDKIASDGILDIQTTSGDISVNESSATGISLRASSGDIDAGRIAGEIEIRTTSGDIEIADANGFGSFFSSSGTMNLSFYNVSGDINCNTTSGRINLTIPEAHTFNFLARTTSGSINVPFADRLETTQRAAIGAVGENPEFQISLTATSGNIRVRYR